MFDDEEAVAVLRRMEENQRKALEMQMEQLALVKAQMERAEARVQESIGLQKVANLRQARVFTFVLPLLLLALVYVGYLLFKYS